MNTIKIPLIERLRLLKLLRMAGLGQI